MGRGGSRIARINADQYADLLSAVILFIRVISVLFLTTTVGERPQHSDTNLWLLYFYPDQVRKAAIRGLSPTAVFGWLPDVPLYAVEGESSKGRECCSDPGAYATTWCALPP